MNFSNRRNRLRRGIAAALHLSEFNYEVAPPKNCIVSFFFSAARHPIMVHARNRQGVTSLSRPQQSVLCFHLAAEEATQSFKTVGASNMHYVI